MMSSKKIIIIVLVGLVVVGIAGGFLLQFKLGGKNLDFFTPPNGPLDNNVANNVNPQDTRLTWADGLTEAEKILLQKPENYLNLLKLQRICNNQENDQAQAECQENLILNQILLVQRADLCSQLASKENDCLATLADINDDPALCEKIQDQNRRTACSNGLLLKKGFQTKSLSECASLDKDIKGACVANFISQQNDIKICDDPIVTGLSANSADICRARILTSQAIATNNKTLCEQIKIDNLKLSCQRFFQTPPKL